jgi:hypothetical protein
MIVGGSIRLLYLLLLQVPSLVLLMTARRFSRIDVPPFRTGPYWVRYPKCGSTPAGLLRDPGSGGVGGDPGEVDATAIVTPLCLPIDGRRGNLIDRVHLRQIGGADRRQAAAVRHRGRRLVALVDTGAVTCRRERTTCRGQADSCSPAGSSSLCQLAVQAIARSCSPFASPPRRAAREVRHHCPASTRRRCSIRCVTTAVPRACNLERSPVAAAPGAGAEGRLVTAGGRKGRGIGSPVREVWEVARYQVPESGDDDPRAEGPPRRSSG